MRTRQKVYGKAWLKENPQGKSFWHVKAEPHIILRMKRVFERISKGDFGEIVLADTDEYRRELEWFLIRYPLEISAKDKAKLAYGTKRFRERILTLEKILGPRYKARSYPMAVAPRVYQTQAAEIILKNNFLLLADDVGLGKSCSAIAVMTDRRALPALVVTLAGVLPSQWAAEVKKFLPNLTTHVVRNGPLYELPLTDGKPPDVVIMNYHKLSKWAEVMASYVNYVVFDECQELRRTGSLRYDAARHVARSAKYRVGLSATPIFNLGGEIFSILDVLQPDCLGDYNEFYREWCSGWTREGKAPAIRDPKAFGTYLREQFLMIRRTREEVKRELPPLTKVPHYIETDPWALESIKSTAVDLAKTILSSGGAGFDKMRAAEELDWKLRQATGLAKAPYVADFVQMLLEDGESVMVYAWHREVYTVLVDRLAQYSPVLFTGEESEKQKLESKRKFLAKESKLMLMSLRAGQGVDGLQAVCKTVVFAELDWAAGVHEQCTGRIYRDGQKDPVCAYFLISNAGSDPVVAEALGIKGAQLDAIRDPNRGLIEELQADPGKIKKLAAHYLERLDIKIEEVQKQAATAEDEVQA